MWLIFQGSTADSKTKFESLEIFQLMKKLFVLTSQSFFSVGIIFQELSPYLYITQIVKVVHDDIDVSISEGVKYSDWHSIVISYIKLSLKRTFSAIQNSLKILFSCKLGWKYVVYSINFQTFFVQAFRIVVDS